MTNWKNLDTLDSYKALKACKGSVDLTTVMAGESGADRAKNYSVPMAEKLTYNFAAKEVDDTVLEKLAALAKEAELVDKFQELYNGAVINTGENRLVLHQMTRGQLGEPVKADGVDSSRTVLQSLQIRYTMARSQMQLARSSQRLYRSVSVVVTLVLVQCILHLRTGQRRTAHSRWMRSSSAT